MFSGRTKNLLIFNLFGGFLMLWAMNSTSFRLEVRWKFDPDPVDSFGRVSSFHLRLRRLRCGNRICPTSGLVVRSRSDGHGPFVWENAKKNRKMTNKHFCNFRIFKMSKSKGTWAFPTFPSGFHPGFSPNSACTLGF